MNEKYIYSYNFVQYQKLKKDRQKEK